MQSLEARRIGRRPAQCEYSRCRYGSGWRQAYGLSGELGYVCPQCRRANYPPIEMRSDHADKRLEA